MNLRCPSIMVVLLTTTVLSAAEPDPLPNSASSPVPDADRGEYDLFYQLLNGTGPIRAGFAEQGETPFAEEAQVEKHKATHRVDNRRADQPASEERGDMIQAAEANEQAAHSALTESFEAVNGGEAARAGQVRIAQNLKASQSLPRKTTAKTGSGQPSYLPNLKPLRASATGKARRTLKSEGTRAGELPPLTSSQNGWPVAEKLPPPLASEGSRARPLEVVPLVQPGSVIMGYQMDPDAWLRQKIQACNWNPNEGPLHRWCRNQRRNRQLFGPRQVLGGCGAGGSCGTQPQPCQGRHNACQAAYCLNCQRPKWFGGASALFLRRDNSSQEQALVVDGATGDTLTSSGDLGFDVEPGVQFALGRRLGRYFAVEAEYFGLHEWGDSSTVVGDNDLRLPGDIGLSTLDFLDADIMRVDYVSEIRSGEVSAIRSFRYFEVLGGFRYFGLEETFNVNSEDPQNGVSDYSVGTRNSLYGGQLGLRVESNGEIAYLRCTTKAGVFGVDSRQRTFLADFDNSFILRDSVTSDNDVAFLGEVNLDAIIPLTRHFRLRGGYKVMWVEGVALAMDQLDFTDTPSSGTGLDQTGGAFFYGANAGLEVIW